MRPHAALFGLAAGAVVAVALVVALVVAVPPTPAPIPSCGNPPTAPGYESFPADQTHMVFADYSGGGRITIWSNASASYALFLQNQAQYSAYAANGSGLNGSMHSSPPTEYVWTSGPTTVTNHTLALASDNAWYVLVSNPQPETLVVNLQIVTCESLSS